MCYRAPVRAVIAIVVLVCIGRDARAEDRRILDARTAFEAQEQEKAIALLAPVLTDTSLDDHARATALRLDGCAELVLGNKDAAIARFTESFALEPDSPLEPDLAQSPYSTSVFELARGQWRAALVTDMQAHAAEIAAVKLAVTAPKVAHGGEKVPIDIAITDPAKLVARVELSYRHRGVAAFTTMTTRPAAPLRLEVPAEATASANPFVLEYHVTLRHQSGFDLVHDGSRERPHQIGVSAGHVPRWHESWWVRGAFAAGVIGLGAGGYLFYRSIDVGPQHVVVR